MDAYHLHRQRLSRQLRQLENSNDMYGGVAGAGSGGEAKAVLVATGTVKCMEEVCVSVCM